MRKVVLILFLLLLSRESYSQKNVIVEHYANGAIKTQGSFDKKGRLNGGWLLLDSLKSDTIGYYNFKNGSLNGKFVDFYQGTNMKSKYLSSQLDNYSNWSKEVFRVEGFYKNGLLNGTYSEYYVNGQIREQGYYSLGSKSGEFKSFHDNGQLNFIQNYDNGVLNGPWKQFYETGKLREERVYKKERELSCNIYEWYDNGNMKSSSSYKMQNGEKLNHGEFVQYFETGQVRLSSFYEDGKPNGTWKGYYENGSIKYMMVYENFICVSYTEYDENGMEKKKN